MRVLLSVLCLLLAGCVTGQTVSVPMVPAWQQPAGARNYTAAEVAAQCAVLAPGALLDVSDGVFVPVSHEWLLRVLPWSWEFSKAAGISYVAESFDCDDFAAGFAFAANIAARKAGVKAQPLCARIFVRQLMAFGGVPGGGAHALNGVFTDRGLYVFEPQTRALIAFIEYPNRGGIYRIKIGG